MRESRIENMSKTYYGFHCANTAEEPAWFHTPEAAARFAEACGFIDTSYETTTDVDPNDVMDTPEQPWFRE